jgi:hypothetical protein
VSRAAGVGLSHGTPAARHVKATLTDRARELIRYARRQGYQLDELVQIMQSLG